MSFSKKYINVSIVIPARNESSLLPKIIPDIISYCKNSKINNYELLVILNGCTDNSFQILRIIQLKYPQIITLKSEPGYGKALRKGLENSRGKYIAIYNADFYDNKLLDLIKIDLYGKDFIIGSKMAPWSKDFRSPFRKAISYLFNIFLKYAYGFSGSDTHGIKLIRQEVVKKVLPLCTTDTGIFDTEFVIKSQRMGYKFADFPVTVKEIRFPRFKSRLLQTPQDIIKLHKALDNNIEDKNLFYDSVASTWENFINKNETNKRLRVVYDNILRNINLKNKTFLEVGCGLGYFIKVAKEKGANIYGIDIGKNLVDRCQKVVPGKYQVGSAEKLPYKDNYFDIVLCTEVIEHTPHPSKSISELIRVVKPKGIVIITTPNKLYKPLFYILSFFKIRPYQGVENWLSVKELKSTILKNRGRIIKEYHFNLFYPHFWLDKLENHYPFSIFTINQGYLVTK